MKVVYRGVNFFQPRMKIFSKFEISRGKGEAEERKIARKNEQFTSAMITSDPGNNLRAFDA